MSQIVPDSRSSYHDLTLFGVNVFVDDVVTGLYGVVNSDSEDEIDKNAELVKYLTQTNAKISPQSIARTKQTARKTDNKGQLPVTMAGVTPVQNPALQSPGGLPHAAHMMFQEIVGLRFRTGTSR